MVKAEPWTPKTPMVKVEPFTPMVKAEPWTFGTPLVKVEPFTLMVKAEPFTLWNPFHRSSTRKVIKSKKSKSPHYLAAFKIKLSGKLKSPAICSTFLAPPALPATPSPEELTRIFKQHTPSQELVSGKKALQAANGKLLDENASLQSQVATLTNVKNRLEIEAAVSDGKMKFLESDITTLEHALERARSCHQDAVLKVVELQLAICKAEQAEHLSIGNMLSPASNALSTPSSVDGTAHAAQ